MKVPWSGATSRVPLAAAAARQPRPAAPAPRSGSARPPGRPGRRPSRLLRAQNLSSPLAPPTAQRACSCDQPINFHSCNKMHALAHGVNHMQWGRTHALVQAGGRREQYCRMQTSSECSRVWQCRMEQSSTVRALHVASEDLLLPQI